MAKVQLIELAYGRSGDKGNASNVGIIARTPDVYPFLVDILTPERVGLHPPCFVIIVLYLNSIYFKGMKNVSLKLDDPVYFETEEVLEALGKSRNRYINEAVAHYNVIQKRELIKAQLERESKLVSAESMKMNRILEELGDGDEQI